jgi:hypothetical protein
MFHVTEGFLLTPHAQGDGAKHLREHGTHHIVLAGREIAYEWRFTWSVIRSIRWAFTRTRFAG